MVLGSRPRRLALIVQDWLLVLCGAWSMGALYRLATSFSLRALAVELLNLVGVGVLLCSSRVMLVQGNQVRTWRFFKRARLPLTTCVFVAVPKRGNRATNYEVRAYDEGRFVELVRCFTRSGADRCVHRLGELLFEGRDDVPMPSAAVTDLLLCAAERDREREADRLGWRMLLLMVLGFLAVIVLGLLGRMLH